jgi:hypothetical protein
MINITLKVSIPKEFIMHDNSLVRLTVVGGKID